MSTKKSKSIKITSISYEVGGKAHRMSPLVHSPSDKKVIATAKLDEEETSCVPGTTRCVNGLLQRCFNIAGDQSIWMETTETC